MSERDLVHTYRQGADSCVRQPVHSSLFMEMVRQLRLYPLVLNELPLERIATPSEMRSMRKPLQLLLVEDSEFHAEVILDELRRGGYEPAFERVESAEAMTDALARQEWQVVIADYTLPQFSGPAALKLLQEQGTDLPFIIVSGTIDEETAVQAMKAGAHDFVLKEKLGRLVPAVERELREASGRQARRQAEQALQATERRFQSLIEHMSGIVAILAPDGAVQYAGPSVSRILGHRPEELNGKKLAAYVHPDDKTVLVDLLTEMLRQPGVLLPAEFRIQHANGSWRFLGAMGRNLLDHPEVRGIVVNAQDITERKQLEEQFRQAQKMEAIGRLAGGVAHDFNNMLGAITGYSELLLNRAGQDEINRDCLGQIVKAAERAAGLTRQLLIFSRKQVVAPQVLDLGEVVASVYKMLGRLIGEDIELVSTSDPMLACVKADPGQIEQVLLNLAVNARDAMSQCGRLTIETRNVEVDATDVGQHPGVRPGTYVLLSVSDTGCGMDAETQSHIFEPFFTTKEPDKGTGLGLATVYGIVQQSEGYITVDSCLGQGSTFRIYLPRTDEAAQLDPMRPAVIETPTGSETILLVEDEEIVRRMLQQVLRLQEYRVLAAARGEEALRLCEEHEQPIHLLLTDVVMPEMGGRELTERAMALRPDLKILFMSGYTDDAVVRHGVYEAGFSFIQKPFTPAGLAQKLREVLEADQAAPSGLRP